VARRGPAWPGVARRGPHSLAWPSYSLFCRKEKIYFCY